MIVIAVLLLLSVVCESNLLTKAYLLRKVYKRYASSSSTSSPFSSSKSIDKNKNNLMYSSDSISTTQLFSSSSNNNNNNNYNINNENENENFLVKYFIPIFVAVWAIGYSLLSLYETTSDNGMGDLGGQIGVGLIIFLSFGLFGITAFEIFKDDKRYD